MRKEVLDLKCIINGIPIGNMTYDELRRYAYDQIVRKRNFDELVIEGGVIDKQRILFTFTKEDVI